MSFYMIYSIQVKNIKMSISWQLAGMCVCAYVDTL